MGSELWNEFGKHSQRNHNNSRSFQKTRPFVGDPETYTRIPPKRGILSPTQRLHNVSLVDPMTGIRGQMPNLVLVAFRRSCEQIVALLRQFVPSNSIWPRVTQQSTRGVSHRNPLFKPKDRQIEFGPSLATTVLPGYDHCARPVPGLGNWTAGIVRAAEKKNLEELCTKSIPAAFAIQFARKIRKNHLLEETFLCA